MATPIDAGRPVGLQLDSYHLDYFTTKVHFGGHVVAMYGYDDQDALFRNLYQDFLAECAELMTTATCARATTCTPRPPLAGQRWPS
ncbi:hypothetical protein GCM10018783_20810 [Streptomyces griseosporeus]|nr:hypothetical protein GCM10018783_20810 [Streptomyces griseosporeus]